MFIGIPAVKGGCFIREHHSMKPLDQIANITKRAGLRAITVYSESLTLERLIDEIGDDSTIIGAHPRAVSVKYPDDPRIQPIITVVGHGKGFCIPLGLDIARAWPNGIDAAVVALCLWMNFWISIDL